MWLSYCQGFNGYSKNRKVCLFWLSCYHSYLYWLVAILGLDLGLKWLKWLQIACGQPWQILYDIMPLCTQILNGVFGKSSYHAKNVPYLLQTTVLAWTGTCHYMQGLHFMAPTVPNLYSSFLPPKTPIQQRKCKRPTWCSASVHKDRA